MIRVYTLGTGASVSDAHRSTTMLALDNGSDLLAVDCGADLHQRMLLVGLAGRPIRGLLLTHHHADHIAGFPLLVQKLWLAELQDSLTIWGPAQTLAAARSVLEVFAPDHWRDRIELIWNELDPTPESTFEIGTTWSIKARWVDHIEPTLGLRFTDRGTGKVAAYSGDTAPCEAVELLGADADLLVHEATGDFPGHSTAVGAAATANRCRARQ
ncbi:MAG: MBL fold metallo-hydrolase, partial [Spirochaetota bacterium]